MNHTNQTESSVGIYDFVILALANKPFIYEDIDRMYENRKMDCLRAYRQSSFQKSPALKNHTMKKEVYIRKLAGLFALMLEENAKQQNGRPKHQSLNPLIKKAYKYTWNYVQNKKNIVLDLFSRDYIRRVGEENINEIDIAFNETILLFVAELQGKRVDTRGTMYGLLGKFIQETCKIGDVEERPYTDLQMGVARKEIESLRKSLYIAPSKKNVSMDMLIERIIVKETANLPGFTPFNALKSREKVFKKGQYSRYIGAISGFLKNLGVNEMEVVTECQLTSEDIDDICFSWPYFQKGNNLPDEMKPAFLTFFFMLYAVVKEYQEAKRYGLEIASEEQYHDMLFLQEEINRQKESVLRESQEANRLKTAIDSERVRYEKEIDTLQKELQQLKHRVAESQKNEKELLALRQFTHYQSVGEVALEEMDDETLEDNLDFLQKQRIVVLGGHIKWQQRLKKNLPNITFLNPDNKNTNLSFLANPDIHLFVNTATNSHSFMSRVFAQIGQSGTKLHYINANQNTQKTVAYMKQVIETYA